MGRCREMVCRWIVAPGCDCGALRPTPRREYPLQVQHDLRENLSLHSTKVSGSIAGLLVTMAKLTRSNSLSSLAEGRAPWRAIRKAVLGVVVGDALNGAGQHFLA